MTQPSLLFVIVFLLFSLIFFFNSYKLWFKTDTYYEELYKSLSNPTMPYPFKDFFLKRMDNRKRWEVEQKVFSTIGILAVLAADVLVVAAWISG
jgi:hypothetical protein